MDGEGFPKFPSVPFFWLVLCESVFTYYFVIDLPFLRSNPNINMCCLVIDVVSVLLLL